MHKSVLPKDIEMPAATLAYPLYTYQQMQWWESIPVPLELNQKLHALACTATADCSKFQLARASFGGVVAVLVLVIEKKLEMSLCTHGRNHTTILRING